MQSDSSFFSQDLDYTPESESNPTKQVSRLILYFCFRFWFEAYDDVEYLITLQGQGILVGTPPKDYDDSYCL